MYEILNAWSIYNRGNLYKTQRHRVASYINYLRGVSKRSTEIHGISNFFDVHKKLSKVMKIS